MGCPISSFKEFETQVKQSRQKWNIILLANAESDSRAVDYIIKNYHELDIVSDDVRFYLPGYDLNGRLRGRSSWARLLYGGYPRDIEAMVKDMYPDFHVPQNRSLRLERQDVNIPSPRVAFIDSPTYGHILFNIAEFSDFVIQLTRKIEDFHYLGDAQMVIVHQEDGDINYSFARTYDLSALAISRNLDRFFHEVFIIIREGNCDWEPPRLTDILKNSGQKNVFHSIIAKIERLYDNLSQDPYFPTIPRSEELALELVHKMSNLCGWNIEVGNYYFLSYAEADHMYAYTLKRSLENVGVYVWMAPYSIPQDTSYAAVIPTAIKLARNFLVLISPNSIRSESVKSEISIARRNASRTKTRIILKDISVGEVLRDNELEYMIGTIHMRYNYYEVTRDKEKLSEYLYD